MLPFANNIIALRGRFARFLGITHGGNRDLYSQFGWPIVLNSEQLWQMYLRNGLANRIVKSFPQATWRDDAIVRDVQGDSAEKTSKTYSPFVEACETLFESLQVYRALERADRIASIGRYGVIFLGFNDGRQSWEPLRGNAKILYLQPYAEINAEINKLVQDERDQRYGLPEFYTLRCGGSMTGDKKQTLRTIRAHWTRVIHIAEYLDEDNVYGTPRLFPIFNLIQDLEKVTGASAETFWYNSRPGLSLEMDPEFTASTEQIDAFKAQANEFENQLRRIFTLQGIKANLLTAQVADPQPNITAMLDILSGAVQIPKRILIGSEAAALASLQDENNWSERIRERRRNFAGPSILVPLVTKLIATGNLPQPNEQFWIQWPEDAISPESAANIGQTKSNTLRNYVMSPGAELIVPAPEFRQKFLGLSPTPEEHLLDDMDALSEIELSEPEETQEPELEDTADKNGLDVAA
jgi:uncharacterized protein